VMCSVLRFCREEIVCTFCLERDAELKMKISRLTYSTKTMCCKG